MTGHIMLLDVLELGGLFEGRHVPVQISEPAMDGRITASDIANVALKVLDIDCVEADDGYVQAYIGFGEMRTEIIRSLGSCGVELGFGLVEVSKEVCNGGVVGFLRAGESGLARR